MQKTQNLTVSEEEAKQIFEENKDVLIEPIQMRVSEIVVADKAKAEEILISILQGNDFAEAARMHSISDSAEKGGDLGYLEEVPFPQMGNQLVTLEEGDVSRVFSGPQGYYIIKVDEKSGGEPMKFEDVKDMIIEQQTMIKQQQVVLDYIERLRGIYDVDINESLIK